MQHSIEVSSLQTIREFAVNEVDKMEESSSSGPDIQDLSYPQRPENEDDFIPFSINDTLKEVVETSTKEYDSDASDHEAGKIFYTPDYLEIESMKSGDGPSNLVSQDNLDILFRIVPKFILRANGFSELR
jgi:hypothetical protein